MIGGTLVSPWPPERLDDRFKAIDEALKGVQYDLRVISPLAGQVGILDANLTLVRTDLKELKAEIREDRATSRSEVLKLIGVVVAFFSLVAGAPVIAVLTGLVGS